MVVPHCVLEILNNQQITHQIVDVDVLAKMAALCTSNNAEQLALMVPLNAAGSQLQAIVSSNSLLNLDALNEHTGAHVEAFSETALQQLLAAKGLETLPAIPDTTGYETFVDAQLLQAETIYIESGKKGTWIALTNADFRLLTGQSHSMQLGIALSDMPSLSGDKEDDAADIYAAIRNYTSLQIKKRLADTLEIPPLSATGQKILKLSADPNAAIEDLVKAIEIDPSLAAQVVGWAASPYYSAPGKVKSIQDAIVRVLGYELVLNLALGLAMGQALKAPDSGPCAITLFWRQSVYCALTMDKLNRALPANKRGEPGLAYLSGLMNNFSYLILNHVFPAHFSILCQYMAANRHLNPMYTQQHLLGITGEQMSSQLAEIWNLPIQIQNALRFQQDPQYNGPDAVYANLCFISTRLLAAMEIGNLPSEAIPPALYKQLQLDPADVDQIMQEIAGSQEEIEMMLSGLAA